MTAQTAAAAINGILNACSEQTKAKVLTGLQTKERPRNTRKTSKAGVLMQAREDLIKNHFKQ